MENCLRCGSKLSGKQEKYCSKRCSKLYLKAQYRKRNREKYAKWNIASRGGDKSKSNFRLRKIVTKKSCLRCGSEENLNYHHIKPRRLGGEDSAENVIVLCFSFHMKWHQVLKNDFWIIEGDSSPIIL